MNRFDNDHHGTLDAEGGRRPPHHRSMPETVVRFGEFKIHSGPEIPAVRRVCMDQMIMFGETHLRPLMTMYTSYYNEARRRLSLGKDSPTTRPIMRFGRIIAEPMVGDLHHRYA